LKERQDSEISILLMTQYGLAGKPFYSREEVTKIVLELHGRHLAATFLREMELLEIRDMQSKLEEDHAKGLGLLFEIEAKNVSLERFAAKLEESYRDLEAVSRNDSLTGMLNRRSLLETAEIEVKRARRSRERMTMVFRAGEGEGGAGDCIGAFSVALVDIDRFKLINDTYGRARGDEVLRRVGALAGKGFFRATDYVGRYGGDELIMLFPDTRSVNATVPMGKYLEAVGSLRFETEAGAFNVTVSAGISELRDSDQALDEVIARADKALYLSKNGGRNKMAVYESQAEDGSFPEPERAEARNCIHFSMRPVWDRIDMLSGDIAAFMGEFDDETVYDVKMAAVELVENAVKYGYARDSKDEIQIDVSLKDGAIEIEVTNWVHERAHLENLRETIRRINGTDDPKSLYVSRLESLMREDVGRTGSQLGLVRIAYVGGFGLELRESDKDCVTIRAFKNLRSGN
jgi:diguanylate cyclase (GGDEF)-like protein